MILALAVCEILVA